MAIAAYNIDQYLGRCLDSVIAQTFTDFECIVIDDGSSDGTGAIAEAYARRDGRIRVVHQENVGLALTRNRSIDEAQGKYLYMMDGDDWLSADYLQNMFEAAERYDAQAVIGGYLLTYQECGGRLRAYAVAADEAVYTDSGSIRRCFHRYLNSALMAPQWNKIYRLDYLRQRQLYVPNVSSEDMHFNIRVFRDLERLAVCPKAGYYYVQQRSSSILTSESWQHLCLRRQAEIEDICQLYRYWGIRDAAILDQALGYCAAVLMQCIAEICASDCRHKMYILRYLLNRRQNGFILQRGKISSGLLSVAAIPARMRCVPLCWAVGIFIGCVKRYAPRLFYYLQAISVHRAKAISPRPCQ